jgi:hypothetical protein
MESGAFARARSVAREEPMRTLTNILIIVMLLGILGSFGMHYRTKWLEHRAIEDTKLELRRFQREVHYRATLGDIEGGERRFPRTIEPLWFNGDLPVNELLGPEHPWCDIAGLDEKHLHHPADRVAAGGKAAKFWYNPYTGAVRARVPSRVIDTEALELYNYINDSDLQILFAGTAMAPDDDE